MMLMNCEIIRTPESIAPLIDDIVTSCSNSFGIFLTSDAVDMIMSLNGTPDYYHNDEIISLMFTKKDAENYIKTEYDSYENFCDSIRELKHRRVRF